MNLLPCDQPPAIEIFLKTPDNESLLGKFDSSEPSSTTAVPLDDVAEFRFIVSWISIQTVTIMVCFHVCMQIYTEIWYRLMHTILYNPAIQHWLHSEMKITTTSIVKVHYYSFTTCILYVHSMLLSQVGLCIDLLYIVFHRIL